MRDLHLPGRSPALGREAMVATSHAAATLAGVDILRAGGNAVDAAVAAAAVQGVVEPQMTSPGGDVFALVAMPDGQIHGLNASGRAPAGLDADAMRAKGWTAIDGDHGLAVSVPGAVKGWAELVSRFGTKGLDSVLNAAIDHAENGYPVSQRVAFDWSHNVARLYASPGARKHLLRRDGKAPHMGEMVFNKALAQTLRSIAEKGPDGFYSGSVAEDMCAAVQAAGGVLTPDDLAAVSADTVDPIFAPHAGSEVVELPPNTQGMIAHLILRILSGFDHATLDPTGPERFHLEIEAARLAYAVRDQYLADPDHMVAGPEAFLSDDFVDGLRGRIDPDQRIGEVGPISSPGSDTIVLSVVDGEGMAVTLINSIFKDFGGTIVGDRSGVVMQNRAAGFNLIEGHANCAAPGKRPLHTLIPGLIRKDGKISHAFGVMGGQYQACGHAHVVSNLLDFGMDPQEALDCPRVFMDGFAPDSPLTLERGIPAATLEGLLARGHRVEVRRTPWGGGQVIGINPASGVRIGGSDPRKDGAALGF
jgi:gamma-glutamyltranspeptidase/glutathione hydrolase